MSGESFFKKIAWWFFLKKNSTNFSFSSYIFVLGHKRHRDTGGMELDMSSPTFSSSSATHTDEPIENSSSISVLPSTPLGITATLRTQLEQLERDREALQSGEYFFYNTLMLIFNLQAHIFLKTNLNW